ncbi:MAG: antibiotic ABC transporter ATP-binding protein [Bacteroidetes bacterium GWF2_38_335]|nr:MAG: antibiotic ABC transporter ATP-binding protein [Bacteroidetes bacterium GWF2_38_335]OFY78864.1 MAG: antibiotic ABC transporter ATP-binding protein [Bacteroidetes bacterium RIFOXYA12_FULL_38_20]HBS86292.1 antibiotic ABC transporter ATP-binding protein [Bacteroidales bacterium]
MRNINKILSYLKPYWVKAVLNIIFDLISVFFSLFTVVMAVPFLSVLFDNDKVMKVTGDLEFTATSIKEHGYYLLYSIKQEEGAHMALLYLCLVIIVMSLFRNLFRYLALHVLADIRNNIVRDIRNRLYNKILRLPISFYSEEKKGDIISRMSNDVQEIEASIMSSLEMLFRSPLEIIIYMGALFMMSTQLTIFVIVLLAVGGYVIGAVGKSLKKQSRTGQRRVGGLLTIIEETLSGLRVIKAFNAEEKSYKNFKNQNDKYANTMVSIYRKRFLANPLSEFMGTAIMVMIMWYGGKLVLTGDINMNSEELIGYLLMFYFVITPAKSFSTAWYNIQKGLASVERVDMILEADDKIYEKENPIEVKEFNNSIEFRNVSFKYADDYVLKNINLKIEKGKTIALVGQSGSGKSTLVDLIPRFHDVTEGEILIDGISVKDIKIKNLRNLIGFVNQEPILFNDTFFNNIAFSSDLANPDNVIGAAKVANAHDFIMANPEGYEYNIGDRGGKLSGGQRQRISIARAVFKNPPVMILDEATSALDTESERLVQDALYRLMENRTSIVIAHRLSTITNADEICVLNEGEIVERGRHEELLALNGYYKKLHEMQMFSA